MTLVISDEYAWHHTQNILGTFWQGKSGAAGPVHHHPVQRPAPPPRLRRLSLPIRASRSTRPHLRLPVYCSEGFRPRTEIFTTEKCIFVASENTLAEDIGSLVKEKFALMGEVPP